TAIRGTWRTCAPSSLDGVERLHQRVIAEIIDAVADLKSPAAADLLRSEGVELLHAVIEPLDIRTLRDRVLDALRADLLKLALNVGRSALDWNDEFYIDDYLILRINL